MPRLYYLVVKASATTPFVPPPDGEGWHVSHAALAESSAVNNYATLSFKTSDGVWISLGTLHSSGRDFMSLDLPVAEYTEFKATGNVDVHLTGTLVEDEEPMDIDEDDIDDEVMEAVMNGGRADLQKSLMQQIADSDEESSEEEPELQRVEEVEPPKLAEKGKPVEAEAVVDVSPEGEKEDEIPTGLSKSAAKRLRKKKRKEAKAAEKLEPRAKQQKMDKSPPAETPQVSPPGKANGAPSKKRVRRFSNGFVIETLFNGPDEGPVVENGKKIAIKYKGQLEDGTVFDQSRGSAGFSFQYGNREVVRGLDKGLDGMRVGDKRRLTVPAKMGYGSQGAEPSIPPNADLTFEVELLKID